MITAVVVHVEPDGAADVFYQPNEITVTLAVGGRTLPGAERVATELAAGFLVRVAPDGRVLGLTLAPGRDPTVRTYASSIAGFMAVVAGPGTLPYEHDEVDVLGPLHARYTVSKDPSVFPGGLAIDKTIAFRRPAKVASHPREQIGASVRTASQTRIRYEVVPSAGTLREVTGTLANETWLGAKLLARDTGELSLRAVANRKATPDELAAFVASARAFEHGVPATLDSNPEQASKLEAEERDLAQGETVAQLAAALRVPGGPVNVKGEELGRVIHTLRALFRTKPESIADARRLLEARTTDPVTFMTFASALAQSDRDAATTALLLVLKGKPALDPARRGTVLELSAVPRPSREVTAALLDVARTDAAPALRETALLVYGVTLGRVSAIDPERTATGIALVAERLQGTEAERVLALRTLGNIGSAGVAAHALPLVTDAAVPVRLAALDALRFVDVSSAREALLRGALDPDPRIRERCITNLEYRPAAADILDRFVDRALHDEDGGVRAVATGAVLRLRGTFETAYAAVERLRREGTADVVALVPRGG